MMDNDVSADTDSADKEKEEFSNGAGESLNVTAGGRIRNVDCLFFLGRLSSIQGDADATKDMKSQYLKIQ